MRVEVDDCQRPAKVGPVGPKQGQGDGVVSAYPCHVVLSDQGRHQRHHGRAHGLQAGIGQRQVPCITRQSVQRHVEERMDAIAQHVAGLPDGAWAEACPGPVGDTTVPGDAGHGQRQMGGAVAGNLRKVDCDR